MARRYHDEDDDGGGILDWLWVFLLIPGILFLIILVERKRAESERLASSMPAGLEPELQLEGPTAARESSRFQSAAYRDPSTGAAEEEAGAAAPVDSGAAAAAAAEAASSTVESEAEVGAQAARQSGAASQRKNSASVVNHPSQDELEVIEGIGPKIASILRAQGIRTFRQLSETSLERLNEILQEVGAGINPPDTWPAQARLAAEGKWDELDELKSQLKAGRRNGS